MCNAECTVQSVQSAAAERDKICSTMTLSKVCSELSAVCSVLSIVVFCSQCRECRVRQLKGLQLNHFAISCVRTSESGVILSLTTKMMIALTMMMMMMMTVCSERDDGSVKVC